MKFKTLFAAVFLASSSALAAPKELHIASSMIAPPFSSIVNGEFQGFEIDLGNEIAKRLGMTAVWHKAEFENLLLEIAANKYDMAISTQTINEERKKVVAFSDPHYCNFMVMLNKNQVPTLENLGEKSVLVVEGTTYEKYALKNHPRQIKRFNTLALATNSLMFGKDAVLITGNFSAMKIKAKYPNIKISEKLDQEKIGISMNKKNTELLGKVNAALASIMQDGTYTKISKKWFGTDIRCK